MIHLTEIENLEAPELDVFARLTEAQLLNRFEPKKGMFIAESPKVICRALDAGFEPVSLLVERSHCNEEAREAIEQCGEVPVYTAGMEVLTQLTGFQLTRGMLCAMRRKPLPTAEQVVITEPVADAVEAVAEESAFRPAAGIYRTPLPSPDAAAVGEYLASHPSNMTVLDVRAELAAGREPRLPRLVPANGGWRVDE